MTIDDERLRKLGTEPPTTEKPAAVVGALGLLCPLPLVKVARALPQLGAGALVELVSDDPDALEDVPTWCRARHHEYIGVCRDGASLRFFLRKGVASAAGDS